MRCTLTGLAFTVALSAAAASFTGLTAARPPAGAEAVFLVPANDGYGVGECLTSGAACGKVVADAWCQTQGYLEAVGFRLAAADDITGTVRRVSTGHKPGERPVAITCTR